MFEETSSSEIEISIDIFNDSIIENCLETQYIKTHFTDIKKIGAGGFGSVYEATQTIDKRKYALKVIKVFSLNFEKSEVEILASLDHRNVVQYYNSCIIPFPKSFSDSKEEEENSDSDISFEKEQDYFIENKFVKSYSRSTSESSKSSGQKYDACLVIQTELCNPEKNLKTLIDNEELFKMDDRGRQSLVLDIVHGLQYIHNKGVMHRDLKPPNILIGMENQAKIGDFGFARKYIMHDADGISSTSDKERVCFSNNLGTPLYMAPEIKNSRVYDKKADLYSLGMILFEMYYKMGSGMERIQTMERLRNQEFNDLTNISKRYRNVSDIVQNLLNHEPSLRMDLEKVKDKMNALKYQEILEKTDVSLNHLYEMKR